jgi:hypothetical protein
MRNLFNLSTVLFVLILLGGCIKENEDNSKPIIQVLGSNPHYMRLNTPYRDTGVLVMDNYGVLKIWSDITSLDTSHAGRYTIKYFAMDFSENLAEASRTVVVRIEGFNLRSQWSVEKTEPFPGGQVSSFGDSLFNPTVKKIYFAGLTSPLLQPIRADIIGSLGDTLAISKQLILTSDTLISYMLGLGIIQSDAQRFEVFYHRINERPGTVDTIVGKMIYSKLK